MIYQNVMTVEDLTVVGIYEPGILESTLPFNPLFTTLEVLEESRVEL